MKYVLAALASVPLIAVAGLDYAVEILCLVSMVVAALWFIDYVEGDTDSDVTNGAA
ncbi:MAG: hypothetical protein ACJAYU_000253 [Bradymonadia bacterium]|jgi:hypothetical protein